MAYPFRAILSPIQFDDPSLGATGRQPADLPPRKLLKRSALPLDWASSEKSGGHRVRRPPEATETVAKDIEQHSSTAPNSSMWFVALSEFTLSFSKKRAAPRSLAQASPPAPCLCRIPNQAAVGV